MLPDYQNNQLTRYVRDAQLCPKYSLCQSKVLRAADKGSFCIPDNVSVLTMKTMAGVSCACFPEIMSTVDE